MPFFQSRNLKSFMKSNFFCQIISETSLIFVYHDIKRGDFFEKVLEAKKRWGECWIGYDFRWSFTSGGKYYFKLFRTCWRKILRKRKFNSFQFHFKKDFWKLYNYTYFYMSHFKIIFFRNPFLCCLRTSIFHVKRIGKASIQKTTLGVSST